MKATRNTFGWAVKERERDGKAHGRGSLPRRFFPLPRGAKRAGAAVAAARGAMCARWDVYFAVKKAQNKSLRSCLSAGYSAGIFHSLRQSKKIHPIVGLGEPVVGRTTLRLERKILMLCCVCPERHRCASCK
jgi:hypothetical protein